MGACVSAACTISPARVRHSSSQASASAASILLTQLYAAGQLSFAGAVAGLSTSAGVGLAVLFRANKSVKQNVFIVGLLYVLGVCAGMVAGLFG